VRGDRVDRCGGYAEDRRVFAAWSPVVFRLCRDRRLRSASVALFVLVVAVTAGLVMAAAAGARRSDAAYGRFLVWARDAQMTFSGCQCNEAQLYRDFDRIRGAPFVVDSVAAGFADVIPELPDGSHPSFLALQPVVDRDGRLGRDLPRARVLHGRTPNARAADEASVGFLAAGRFHLHVGDTVSLIDSHDDRTRVASVRIVGIHVAPGEFPSADGPQSSSLLLTPAFARAFPRLVNGANDSLLVRIRPGTRPAEIARLTSSLRYGLGVYPSTNRTNGSERTIRVETVALLALALVVSLVGFVIAALMLKQRADVAEADRAKFTALGWDSATAYRFAALDGVLLGCAAALASVLMAIALSPLFPVGIGRIADVDSGWHIDTPVIAIGATVTVLSVCAIRILTSLRRSTTRGFSRTRTRPAPIGNRAAIVVGLYLSRDRRSRAGGASLWSLVSLIVVLAALVAVLLTIASFDRLVRHHELSGATWSAVVSPPADATGTMHINRALAIVRQIPGVAAASPGGWAANDGGNAGSLIVNGHAVDGQIFADDQVIRPAIRHGRAPARAGEIALGAKTMDALGVHLGQTVELAAKPRGQTIRGVIVGEALLVSPLFVDFNPGTGVATVAATLRALGTPSATISRYIFIRYSPKAPELRTFDAIETALGTTEAFEAADRVGPQGLQRSRTIPLLLIAGLLILIGAALGHSMFVSVREHRQDFAILSALGMSRGQTRRSVLIHATLTASVVCALGIPLGVLAGNMAWNRIADNLLVVVQTSVPALALVVVALALLAIANIAALFPTAAVSRRPPATLLRARD
jgi:ABC-type lipoprotein release transport system permease subunit